MHLHGAPPGFVPLAVLAAQVQPLLDLWCMNVNAFQFFSWHVRQYITMYLGDNSPVQMVRTTSHVRARIVRASQMAESLASSHGLVSFANDAELRTELTTDLEEVYRHRAPGPNDEHQGRIDRGTGEVSTAQRPFGVHPAPDRCKSTKGCNKTPKDQCAINMANDRRQGGTLRIGFANAKEETLMPLHHPPRRRSHTIARISMASSNIPRRC